jgi:hypothetical protein
MSKLIQVWRWNDYEGRAYDATIRSDQIESINKVDSRHVNATIRTVSGDTFHVTNDYDWIMARWREAMAETPQS